MPIRRCLAALPVLVLLLSVLPGTPAQGPVHLSIGAPAAPTELVVPAFAPAPGVRTLGPMASSQPLTVALSLQPSGGTELADFATAVSTPGSPSYGHFLSPAGLATAFGAPEASVGAAAAYFESYGLRVTVSPDRLFLSVSGPAGAIASAFHTQFERYRAGGESFFAHPTPAVLPAIAPWYGVIGLGNVTQIRPLTTSLAPAPTSGGCSGSSGGYPISPCGMATAYDYASLWGQGKNGTGTRIGVVDVFDSSENAASLSSDLASFTKNFALASPRVSFAFPTESESSLNHTGPDGWSVEDALDLQWVHGAAPGATITDALAPDTDPGLYGAVDWLVSTHAVDVLSLSWGEPDVGQFNLFSTPCPFECNASSDGSYAMLHPVLEAAAAEGIGVFVASGDCGASDGTSGLSTDYPASDPFATGVGGTVLTPNSDGTYSSESAWSGNASGASSPGCANQGGSGGGFSEFPRPAWQSGPGLPASPATRGVPDVAIDAATGAAVFFQGSEASASGTSLGAPVWTGIAAIADQIAGVPLGFLDPSLYSVLSSGQYSGALHDITTGTNGYAAGPGWDPVTGVGSPIAAVLLPLLAQHPAVYSNLTVRLSASARAGPTPFGVTFSVNVSGGSGRYLGFDTAFGDGNSSWSTAPGAVYSYTVPGSYPASVTVFDSGGNSTTSAPVEEVVGGGSLLSVTLTANRTTVPVGGSVSFTVGVTGGSAPYTSVVQYGDGASALPSTSFSFAHTYGAAGGFCVGAEVSDSASPVNGGNSSPIAIAVGSAERPRCAVGPPLTSGLASNFTLADLPGDFPLRESYSGGTAPVTAWIQSDDSYSTQCQCGIFRTPGVHTVDLIVNDSVGDRTESALSLTLFPTLEGTFTASTLSGTAPLTVNFSARLSGGYLANASLTTWSFGDGANATGAAPSHTYASAGTYLAVADARDGGRGNASQAFLLDVLPATGGGGAPVVTAEVGPAIDAAAGLPVNFTASVTGSSGPYSVEWVFADLSSGFGPALNESFGWAACRSQPGCPFAVSIVVRNAAGLSWSTPFTLDHFLALNGSGLGVAEDSVPSTGTTPFPLTASVGATGMPGLRVGIDYGDGTVLAGASGRHVYLAPGNYTISEVVQDAGHDYWVRHHALEVNGSRIEPLSTGIALAPATGLAPARIQLTALTVGGYGPYTDRWMFGDGSNASGSSVSHVFASPGRYVVDLSANDTLGLQANATTTLLAFAAAPVGLLLSVPGGEITSGTSFPVTLEATPTCGALASPTCASAPISVTLTLSPPALVSASGGAPVAVELTDNQSQVVDLRAPSAEGTWTVTLQVTGANYSGSVSQTVMVSSPAEAALAIGIVIAAVAVGILGVVAVVIMTRRERRTPPPPPPTSAAVAPPPPAAVSWPPPPPPPPT